MGGMRACVLPGEAWDSCGLLFPLDSTFLASPPPHSVILPKGQTVKLSDRFESQDTQHLVKNFLMSGGVIKIQSPAQTGTETGKCQEL